MKHARLIVRLFGVVIAGLLVIALPYAKILRFARYACAGLMTLLAGCYLMIVFGNYFFSARFLLEVIPVNVWINTVLLLAFFALQLWLILTSRKQSA